MMLVAPSQPAEEIISAGALEVDPVQRRARLAGRELQLSTKEFDLLALLAGHPERIYTRDQLLSRVWGYDFAGDTRTVDVHVSWLRGKLREIDGQNHFRTVRGVGYAFSPEPVR